MPPNPESLDFVAAEMRHRETTQDAQAATLATKASYLFTAGTATVGAAVAVLGLLINQSKIGSGLLFGVLLIPAVAYCWLVVSFFQAYRVQSFLRTPDPERLMDYTTFHPNAAKTFLTDGRREALLTNARTLENQADWVNRQLIATLVVIGGFSLVLLIIALF